MAPEKSYILQAESHRAKVRAIRAFVYACAVGACVHVHARAYI